MKFIPNTSDRNSGGIPWEQWQAFGDGANGVDPQDQRVFGKRPTKVPVLANWDEVVNKVKAGEKVTLYVDQAQSLVVSQ